MYDASLDGKSSSISEVGESVERPVESRFPLLLWKPGVRKHQLSDVFTLFDGQNPHGVESDSKSSKGILSELGNPAVTSFGMAEVTGDRNNRGRSLRSSLRTGKPSTWRRETVDTVCKQEEGKCQIW
jgi:hypothetical protein